VSPPLQESGGNVSMVYNVPLAVGTGATPPLVLNYAPPLMLNASNFLTVDPTWVGAGITDAPNDANTYARHAAAWLALGTMAAQNASAVNITGGSINGISIDGGSY
jgi:hypothetical protein